MEDRDVQTAYLLFRFKNMTPQEYYNKKPGEKKILRAFIAIEINERHRANSQDGV